MAITPSERTHGVLERRWSTAAELDATADKLLPTSLPPLVARLLPDWSPAKPIQVTD